MVRHAGMTPKMRRFVEEYLTDLNATQAAIRAGYAPKNADVTGSHLLAKPQIAAAIAAAQAKRSARTEVTQARVVQELGLIAFSDMRGLFDAQGKLLEMHTLPEPVARAIASVEVTRERVQRGEDVTTTEWTSKFKNWDKVKALDLLGRHLGMWNDRGLDGAEPIALRIELTHRRAPASHAE